MSDIIKKVLNKIVPRAEQKQKIEETANVVLKKARKECPEEVEAVLVGSVAKGTFLADVDIDVFLRFPIDTNLKEMGLEIARRIVPEGEEVYASHPYLRGEVGGMFVDVVPCYRIDRVSEMKSAVDRTPFHTKYIKDNIKEMRDEVRLAKQFMKGIEVYGASSSIGGFSGYLVEVLIIRYGGFMKVIEWFSNCECPLRIDDMEDNQESVMILRDPVDTRRNVAASVTKDVLSMTILAAKSFLNEPSEDFFFPKKERKIESGNVTTVTLNRPDMDKETTLSWLHGEARKILRNLEEFNIISYEVEVTDEATIMIESEIVERPSKIKHLGPLPWKKGAIEFLDKYPDASMLEGKMVVARKPRFKTISEAILNLIPEAEVKSETKTLKRMPWL